MHALTPTTAFNPEQHLDQCVDALICGKWTEDQFLSQTLGRRSTLSNTPWDVLSVVDQRYRRHQLPDAVFHSIKSRIVQRALFDQGRESLGEEAPPESSAACPIPDPPAARHREAPTLQADRVLRNRYVLEEILWRGATGDVFKACDGLSALRAESESRIAVKVLRESAALHPELIDGLQREFDCTRKLAHANIVKVYEFDPSQELAFYTMELLEGEPIGDLLQRAGRHPPPPSHAWTIIGAAGAALAHAHSRQVVHGALNPRNVMVTRRGEVRLLVFGAFAPPPESGRTAAAPAYASCELLDGAEADPRDDLFSLACLAYELLAGDHPFQGKPSTEARALGLSPRRPPGIGLARWRALQRGLSFTRQGRSISVDQWLDKLLPT